MKALYYGDNLQVLRDRLATESVDLIYLCLVSIFGPTPSRGVCQQVGVAAGG